jgi:hypothetical protein
MLSGCGGSPVQLAPIAGKWIHYSDNNQSWIYEFPSDSTVRFAIDQQSRKWSITEIRRQDDIIEIDVDELLGRGAAQNSTITIEIIGDDTICISSGLHTEMLFEKVT